MTLFWLTTCFGLEEERLSNLLLNRGEIKFLARKEKAKKKNNNNNNSVNSEFTEFRIQFGIEFEFGISHFEIEFGR